MLLEYPIGQRPDLQIKTMELEDGQAKTCGELTTELFLVQTFMFEFLACHPFRRRCHVVSGCLSRERPSSISHRWIRNLTLTN